MPSQRARVPATEILVLPKCKHSPHRDQPDATLERMAEFVAEVTGSEQASE
jgi:pimeloyl-ACP methyl ester carboxylesterase